MNLLVELAANVDLVRHAIGSMEDSIFAGLAVSAYRTLVQWTLVLCVGVAEDTDRCAQLR